MLDLGLVSRVEKLFAAAANCIEKSKPQDEQNTEVFRIAVNARAMCMACRNLIESEKEKEKEGKRLATFHRRCEEAKQAVDEARRAMKRARTMAVRCIEMQKDGWDDAYILEIMTFDRWASALDGEAETREDPPIDHAMLRKMEMEDEEEWKCNGNE